MTRKEYQAEYHKQNKRDRKKYQKKYQKLNKEKINQTSKERRDKTKHTKKSVINAIYNSQISSSKKRNHPLPLYTRSELRYWLLNDWVFDLLWSNWTNCGHIKDMKPSIDRLDDDISYQSDNIRITTWRENYAKPNKGTYRKKKIQM